MDDTQPMANAPQDDVTTEGQEPMETPAEGTEPKEDEAM